MHFIWLKCILVVYCSPKFTYVMKLYVQRALMTLVFIVSSCLLFFVFKQDSDMASLCFCLLSFVLISVYLNNMRHGNLFLCFLVLNFAAEFLSVVLSNSTYELNYVIINTLYVFAYSCLIALLFKNINLKQLWSDFRLFVIALFFFGSVIIYNMSDIMYDSSTVEVLSYAYIMDTVYNVVLILLMCLSFLNFLLNDSKKSLLLFLISLSFVFSEVVQLASVYLIKSYFLFVLFSAFKLIGYGLSCYYIRIRYNVFYRLLS